MEDAVLMHKQGGELHASCKQLEVLLKDEEMYEPVFLGNAQFNKAMNSMQRQRFLDSLSLLPLMSSSTAQVVTLEILYLYGRYQQNGQNQR